MAITVELFNDETTAERITARIDAMTGPAAWQEVSALLQLRAALATIDPAQADAIFAAATTLASAWADAALLVGGWQPTQARGCLPSRVKRVSINGHVEVIR